MAISGRRRGASHSFSSQFDEIVINTEQRMVALVRQATQEVIDIAQTPGPSARSTKLAIKKGLGSVGRGKKKREIQGPIPAPGKGGKMRVDTGFLRNSGRISLDGMPAGPSRGDPGKKYEYDASSVELKLQGVKPGDTIYFGWTASYAKYREAYDGFLASAVQKWQTIVNRITEELRK